MSIYICVCVHICMLSQAHRHMFMPVQCTVCLPRHIVDRDR